MIITIAVLDGCGGLHIHKIDVMSSDTTAEIETELSKQYSLNNIQWEQIVIVKSHGTKQPKLFCSCGGEVKLEEFPSNYPNNFEGKCSKCKIVWAIEDMTEIASELED